jgi:hypothetical protein
VVFLDVYLPEGIAGDIMGENYVVYVIGDFTEEPWKTKIECTYSQFFKAYKATIPVVDGTLFKFVVDDETIVSSDHLKKMDNGKLNHMYYFQKLQKFMFILNLFNDINI